MRQIKFRVWNKYLKHFVGKCFIDSSCGIAGFIDDSGFNACEEYKLIQFTGLKDKHGAEIYEGDIVEFAYNGLFLKGEVVFSNGGWELKGVDYGEHFRLIEIVHLCEVIGNITENSELLGGKNE